ncbi:MAG: hypothetical protein FDX21_02730 [Chlorobium sp.]|nr:MAG: hypothetical protein FDX21_02730 [Chlorobium sp.]
MNERLFLKLLLALFSGLIVAELLVVLLFGFRLELLLFWFILAVAFAGILVVVRLLDQQRSEIDSVSSRRAKMKRSDVMRDRLSEYSVDEEFLCAERSTQGKGDQQEPSSAESVSRRDAEGACGTTLSVLESWSMERESFDEYIRRSMSGAAEGSECADAFSVDLDGAALSKGIVRPPEDFEHSPKSVMASLKRAGMKS